MSLIRTILLETKSCPSPYGLNQQPEIEGHSQSEISYHLKLLSEAGLIEAYPLEENGEEGIEYTAINLTWDGHEFIDVAQDDTVWGTAKRTIIKPGVAFTFDLLLEWLKVKAREKIGLS